MSGGLAGSARPLACALALAGALALAAPAGSTASHEHRLPRALVQLERRMEALRIRSERWEEVLRARSLAESVSLRCDHGRCSRSRSRVPASQSARFQGLVGEDPPEAEIFRAGEEGRSGYILSGSTIYTWVPSACAPGRPWMSAPVPAGTGPPEVDLFAGHDSGRGPYGALIKALASAGRVVDLGARRVAGQRTTAFLALRRVAAGALPPGFFFATRKRRVSEQLEVTRKRRVSEQLEVFIDDEGLPLRVVERQGSARDGLDVAIEVSALNLPEPLGIDAPAADQTRPVSDQGCAAEQKS